MSQELPPSTYNSFKNLVRAAWLAIETERPRFFLFVVLYVIAYSIDLLVPWSVGYIISVLVQKQLDPTTYAKILSGIGAYLGLKLLNTLFHHTGRYVQNTVTFTARMATLTRVFDAVLRFPLNWHVQKHSGENLSRIQRSTGAVEQTVGTYIWQIVEGLVKVVFASIALFALDLWVATAVFSLGAITIAFMILFNSKLVERIRKINWFNDKISRVCVDYLVNIVTVKTLGLEKNASGYLNENKVEGLKLSQKISKYSELKWGSTGIGYAFVTSVSLFIYFTRQLYSGVTVEVGAVYVLLNYLDRIFQAIGSFTGYYGGLIEASTSFEDATKILNEAPTNIMTRENIQIDRTWSSLHIKELSFTYGDMPILRGLDVEIKNGEKIVLVGPSGGGKSTFLKILGGLLTPEKITANTDKQESININELALTTILLPQEPEIFSETVWYNLTMGESYTEQEVQFYVNLCKADGVVAKLPQGLQSSLAEKGLNLSVGEKQRLAMARGLLRAPMRDIILLDEPTSSLDPKTEKEVTLNILHYFKDKTVITACHRLQLVPLFDRIIFIRFGVIEEVGTFEELIAKKGPFYYAWEDYEKRLSKVDGVE